MINENMRKLGAVRSVIRELFEYGKKRKAEVGEDNVYDQTDATGFINLFGLPIKVQAQVNEKNKNK